MNRIAFTPLILMLLVTIMTHSQTKIKSLNDLRWQKRIILVFSQENNFIKSVKEVLEENFESVNERHIAYFLLNNDSTFTNYPNALASEFSDKLMKRFADNKFQNKIILIGKDGRIKLEEDTFNLMKIFRLIDSMPMRQREMKSRN